MAGSAVNDARAETGPHASADALLAEAVLSDEGRQDPYPIYRQLRQHPNRWRSALGSWVLTGYADGMEALRHPRLGRGEPDMDLPPAMNGRERPAEGNEVVMLFLNPPDHTRIRGLVSREFTPRRVELLRPRLRNLLEAGLRRLADRGGGDVMAELAVPFPVAVISELLGVPSEGNEHIRPLVSDSTAFIDAAADDAALQRAELAVISIAEYFEQLVEEKRRKPDDGLLSALMQVEAEGDRLSHEELIANTMLLYAAGFETTSNLIGNGLRLLLEHPEQMERLREEPQLLPSAVWEMLRADSPVQLNVRAVLEEVELFGRTHPRGTQFLVLQGSGNHDDEVYPDAGSFDVGRFAGTETPPPLSFGWGAHHCLGAHLARAEAETVFGALLQHFEQIELDRAALGDRPPHYRPSFTLRGLDRLPVRVG
jgi:cytochrome P450